LLELFILGHIMLLATPDVMARTAFFLAILAAVISITMFTKKPKALPVIIASGLTLPFIGELIGYWFVYLNVAVIIFWLIRSVTFGILYYSENKIALSALSVKNAIDSMTTGVMFCEVDGFILLVNKRMQWLMAAITGKIQRNGRHFISLLTLEETLQGCSVRWFEGQNVCILPNGSAWLFGVTEVHINEKKCIQITATDITARWKLTTELQPQNEELARRREELSEAISNLHIASRERETQKAKLRAHDILGERLTALLRIVRNENVPDYALLRNQSQELMDELKSSGSVASPEDEIGVLIKTFAAIGVEVEIHGKFKEGSGNEGLIVKMMSDAVTNAVRNNFATKVSVFLDTSDGEDRIKITHNGF